MKNLLIYINLSVIFLLTAITTNAQKIYFPDNTNNEPDMQLSYIERTTTSTMVGFIYTPSESSEMFIHAGTIIEDAFGYNSKNFSIKGFYANGQKCYLNHAYNVERGEQHLLVFEFEPLPANLKVINIREPRMSNPDYSPWAWNNINLTDNKLELIMNALMYGDDEENLSASLLLLWMLEIYPNDEDLNLVALLIE